MIKLMVDKGADINGVDPFYNEMVTLLMAHGSDVQAKDDDGLSCWEHALRHGHEDTAKLLLSKVDLKALNSVGPHPLVVAAAGGHTGIMTYLLT